MLTYAVVSTSACLLNCLTECGLKLILFGVTYRDCDKWTTWEETAGVKHFSPLTGVISVKNVYCNFSSNSLGMVLALYSHL